MRERALDEEVAGRLHAGAGLARSEPQFQRLLEKLPAAAYTCDPEGLITYFNRHALQLWGRAPKLNDATDRFCGSFRLFSSGGAPIPHDQCWMALALQQDKEFNGHEIVVERPDGSRLTALAHANPIHDSSDRLVGAVNVLVDITDRKRAEESLRDAERHKNEFLATLSHELRNPLAPIRNAVRVLQLEGVPSPERQWAVDVIDRQMRHMARLVDDLLDLSRITSGKLELRKERIELAEIVQAALETSRPPIEERGQRLTVTLAPEAIHLDADSMRLTQALVNLLDNAAKYTESGGHIGLSAERDGGEAVVRIEDTGVGIPAEALPRIFDMFAQVGRPLERAHTGLGVGLALVRRLVELHGGTVAAESRGPGRGSAFIVRLPIAAGEAEVEAPGGAEAVASPRHWRILVVDDNEDAADSLATFLHLVGNEVRTAHDGMEAVESAAAFGPDVVLLDLGLPKLNGYDVARRLRKQLAGVRLIALTGWGQEEDRRLCREAGFDHHLVKPVDLDVLQGLLASLEASPTRRVERA
jgi:signal transduction histidine kinase/ActR/RegA family two-component response regulator